MRNATEHYKLNLKNEWPEYYLTDVTKSLKGKEVTVYLRWEQMTTIGPYYSNMEKVGSFKVPENYVNESKRKGGHPGPKNRVENY